MVCYDAFPLRHWPIHNLNYIKLTESCQFNVPSYVILLAVKFYASALVSSGTYSSENLGFGSEFRSSYLFSSRTLVSHPIPKLGNFSNSGLAVLILLVTQFIQPSLYVCVCVRACLCGGPSLHSCPNVKRTLPSDTLFQIRSQNIASGVT
jgi:hypothetical protein